MTTEKIHAVDGTLAFEVGPNDTRPGVRVTTHIPTTGSTLSIPLDEDNTQAMAMAMLVIVPDDESPAAQSDNRPDLFHMTVAAESAATDAAKAAHAAQEAAAASPVGVGTSDAANGAQGGAGGLGDAIRENLTIRPLHGTMTVSQIADRADELERERDQWRAEALKAQEDRGDLIIDLRNMREVDGMESTMRTSAGARMRDWLASQLGGAQ